MADTRTYIRVHDGMPDHPKVDGLSDRAFRLLVESWCWCSRHLTDGLIPAAAWKKRGSAASRKELLAAGLVEQLPSGDVRMHDYLEHQRSAEQVAEVRKAKREGGSYGNHVRWHEGQGLVKEGCRYCPQPPEDDPFDVAEDIAYASQNRSHMRSQTDRKTSPETVSIEGPSVPPVASPSADLSSVSQYARENEALALLKADYRLTDEQALTVWQAAAARARGPIAHPVPYLKRMAERGHLADIVAAVQLPAPAPQPEPETPARPVLTLVPVKRQPVDASPSMPADKARALAHLSICKTLRCPRCADFADAHPDLRRPS